MAIVCVHCSYQGLCETAANSLILFFLRNETEILRIFQLFLLHCTAGHQILSEF